METVGTRVKVVRNQAKLTQAQFANEIGISQTHVSKIEKDVEHPSQTLIRLISIKYNIDEEWLVHGVGSPSPGWDMRTDEGAIAKYNAMRVALEKIMRGRTGKELECTVQTFANIVSLLSANGLTEENRVEYLVAVEESISLIEKQEFATHCLGNYGKIGKNSYKMLLEYKTESDFALSLISEKIRKMNNIILKQLNANLEL